jgi:hypothetical protein
LQEKSEKLIELDERAVLIEKMIYFAYHCQYLEEECIGPDSGLSPIVLHAKMYALGEKYQMKGIKEYAKLEFRKLVMCGSLKDDFFEGAYEAYTSTISSDRGLRYAVAYQAHRSFDELMLDSRFLDLLRKTPDLSTEVFEKIFKENMERKRVASLPQIWPKKESRVLLDLKDLG